MDSEVKEFEIGEFRAKLGFSDHEELGTILDSIVLERELTDKEYEDFIEKTNIESGGPGRKGSISIGFPENLSTDAKRKLQTIESFGGLHGIDEIDWRFAEVEFVPDTDEEKNDLEIYSYNLDRTQKVTRKRWTFDLRNFNWELVEDLRVPMSFYRKGCQLQHQGDFVNAYTNFYLILEGLYADHWRNVEEQFLDSPELVKSVENMMPHAIDLMGEKFLQFFELYGKEVTPSGYLELLVAVRNDLNHFFPNLGGPTTPNPFESEEFEFLSKALDSLAFYILQMKINEIDFE